MSKFIDLEEDTHLSISMEKPVHQRYAVVTGSNKGMGLETVRQLASEGIKVVLTSRDSNKGLEAVESLKPSAAAGLSDSIHKLVFFHRLDVTDPASISSLVDFVKKQFGKLDILVNNAGIRGTIIDFTRAKLAGGDPSKETFEVAEECLNTNYCGVKRMVDALIPLLRLSDSARIVNVSSSVGLLKNIPNERVRQELNDVENNTEKTIDELLNKFLKDFKEGSLEKEGWPPKRSAYYLSKALLNAYTRILARKYPQFLVNSVCPGQVKTAMTYNHGELTPAEGALSAVRLALLPQGGPSGCFFSRHEMASCF